MVGRRWNILSVALALIMASGSAGVNGAVSESAPATQGTTVHVDGGDIYFSPNELTVAQGNTIELVNVGALPHNFVVEGYSDAAPVDLPVGGQVVEWTVPADLAPGQYIFYCAISGHRAAGMWGNLTVLGGSQAPDQAEPSPDDLEQRVAELESQVTELEAEVSALEGQVAALEERLATLEAWTSDTSGSDDTSEGNGVRGTKLGRR